MSRILKKEHEQVETSHVFRMERREMVKLHVSYQKNKTAELTPKQHFLRHFGFGNCSVCRKKGKHKRYFVPVNPNLVQSE